jgi:hypothetical protein
VFKRLFIIGILLAVASWVQAQSDKDLVSVNPKAVTTVAKTDHNPTKSLLLSLIPGGGQIYNGQAWKIPIIYAALGGVGYFVYDYYTNMTAFKNEYLHRVNGGTPQLKGYTNYPNSSIYNLYQSNNKNFQLFVIISTAVYGLNLIDAYVFGHLYDFQVSDDLSLNLSPSLAPVAFAPLTPAPSLQLTFRF